MRAEGRHRGWAAVGKALGVLVVACWLWGGPARAVEAQERNAAARLLREFNEAYQRGDWPGAIAVGLELELAVPGDPVHRYNLACVHALAGDQDGAVQWLERAAAAGFTRASVLRSDPDLEAVRDHAMYAALVAAVEGNLEQLNAEIRRRFEAEPPRVWVPSDHDPTRPAPLLIALHGRGDHADGSPALWRPAATKRRVVLVAPQAVRPWGSGFSWNDPDEADTILGLTLGWARQRLAVDEERIVLTGFSEGGAMALALGLRHPDLFVGVIPMAGGGVPEVGLPPPSGVRPPRYYVMVGADDAVSGRCRRAAERLEAAGYEVALRVLPGVGHAFPKATGRELGKALRFALGE